MNNLTPSELVLMRRACQITRDALNYCEKLIRPGISTKDLDKLVEKFIIDSGGYPACKGYEGFPASICSSVNDMVVHGIPSEKVILKEGDIPVRLKLLGAPVAVVPHMTAEQQAEEAGLTAAALAEELRAR